MVIQWTSLHKFLLDRGRPTDHETLDLVRYNLVDHRPWSLDHLHFYSNWNTYASSAIFQVPMGYYHIPYSQWRNFCMSRSRWGRSTMKLSPCLLKAASFHNPLATVSKTGTFLCNGFAWSRSLTDPSLCMIAMGRRLCCMRYSIRV